MAACTLMIEERVGKAVRSPAKDTLLSHATATAAAATAATGQGRGFAVHEAMDQVGALIGPLTVAGILALTGGDYAPALGVLALPGVAAVALLLWLRARVPDPVGYETTVGAAAPEEPGLAGSRERKLPRAFWAYAVFTAATPTGFAADLENLGRRRAHDGFSLEDLRDRLIGADRYEDEDCTAYGLTSRQIEELKAWALEWAEDLGARIHDENA
ncbi:hypothetical protein ACWC3X_17890 [Streptomyces populi]